jgi:hypothetical protein
MRKGHLVRGRGESALLLSGWAAAGRLRMMVNKRGMTFLSAADCPRVAAPHAEKQPSARSQSCSEPEVRGSQAAASPVVARRCGLDASRTQLRRTPGVRRLVAPRGRRRSSHLAQMPLRQHHAVV